MFAAILKFDPRQPRDRNGRWGSGGATPGGAKAAAASDSRGYKVDEVVSKALGGDKATLARYNKALKDLDADASSGLMTDRIHSVNGDGTGGYSKERRALHRQIVDHHFKNAENFLPPEGASPTLTILGGRGGSGKSNFDVESNPEFGVYSSKKALVVDPDAIKEMLPEYEPSKAFLVHSESTHLADLILRTAKARGLNTVLDITLRSDHSALARRYRKAGYQVEAHYMHRAPEGSLSGAVSRWNRKTTVHNPITGKSKEFPTGRLVPPAIVEANVNNEANFDRLARHATTWSVTSNTSASGFTGERKGSGKGLYTLPRQGVSKVLKYNPYHGKDGKFTSKSKAGHALSQLPGLIDTYKGLLSEHGEILGSVGEFDLAEAKLKKAVARLGKEAGPEFLAADNLIAHGIREADLPSILSPLNDTDTKALAKSSTYKKAAQTKLAKLVNESYPAAFDAKQKALYELEENPTPTNKKLLTAAEKKLSAWEEQAKKYGATEEQLKEMEIIAENKHLDKLNGDTYTGPLHTPRKVVPASEDLSGAIKAKPAPVESLKPTITPSADSAGPKAKYAQTMLNKLIQDQYPQVYADAQAVIEKHGPGHSKSMTAQKKLASWHAQALKYGATDAQITEMHSVASDKHMKAQASTWASADSASASAAAGGKPSFKASKDLAETKANYHELGVHYYLTRSKQGKDHPDTQAAYAEWTKSKNVLTELGSSEHSSLSSTAKEAANKAIQAEMEEVNKAAMQVVTATNAIKSAHAKLETAATAGDKEAAKLNLTATLQLHAGLLTPVQLTALAKQAKADAKTQKAAAKAFSKGLSKGLSDKGIAAVAAKYDEVQFVTPKGSSFSDHSWSEVAKMTSSEKQTVKSYTGSAFSTINRQVGTYGTALLKGGKPKTLSPEVAEKAQAMDSAFAKTTLGYNMNLRRNMASKYIVEQLGLDMTKLNDLTDANLKALEGRIYKETAFSSTSTNLKFSGGFQNSASSGRSVLNIRATKDMPGLPVAVISAHSSEDEVILPRGTTYIIRKVTLVKGTPAKGGYLETTPVLHFDVDMLGAFPDPL